MDNNEGLFRKEALEYQKSKWNGHALLLSGVKPWIIVVSCLFFLSVLIIFIYLGQYTRRINVTGEIITQPRAVTLFSSDQGTISRLFVKLGEQVKKGSPIYEINVSRMSNSGNVSDNIMSAIQQQIKRTNEIIAKLEENKKSTLESLQAQIEQYEQAQAISKDILKDAKFGLKEMRELMLNYESFQKKGLVSKDQSSNQRYLYYQQQGTYQSFFNQSMQEELQLINLKSELAVKAADFDSQILQYEYQRDDLTRQLAETEAGSSLIITAPVDGKIESLSVTDGQMVNVNDSLVQLIPKGKDDAYYLILWIPNDSVPYMSVGDSINVRYDAFPFEKFGQFSGHVESLSSVPASVQEMSKYNSVPDVANGQIPDPYYKAIIRMDNNELYYEGKRLYLSSGMQAQATVFLEKRPIYQWMFTPFYDIKKSIMGPISE